ncbi:MAG: hypothetical protein ABI807_03305 [Sporichthyaceae bacterium]
MLVCPGAQLGVVGDGRLPEPRQLGVVLPLARFVAEPGLEPVDDVAGAPRRCCVARSTTSSMRSNRMSSLAGNQVETVRRETSARSAMRGMVAEA